MIQDKWRSCKNCGGLFLGGGVSVCAAGGKHDDAGSAHYILTDNTYVQGSGLGSMWGVLGVSKTGPGVRGQSDATGVSGEGQESGVHGKSGAGRAVYGENTGNGDGVGGVSTSGTGVFGEGPQYGVHGKTSAGRAVYGENTGDGEGVWGVSTSGTGVFGEGPQNGVHGRSGDGRAVYGENTADGDGVGGISISGTGVFGAGLIGVHGKCDSGGQAVYGENTADGDGVHGLSATGTGVAGLSGTGSGVFGRSNSGLAGLFDGSVAVLGDLQCNRDVEVAGDIRLTGGDCAEEFFVPEHVEPGTVMVIDDDGALAISSGAYDTRVAGVIAGAGTLRPGLVLDSLRRNERDHRPRRAISLVGKAFCHVDATDRPVAVGDLLTSADLPGHAMRVTDRNRACGAILGKALAPLEGGVGLIPILIALQ